MKISKDETKEFELYQVTHTLKVITDRRVFFNLLPWGAVVTEKTVTVEGLVEADDETGLIVRQVRNKNSDFLFTNGKEDIAIDNAAKLLLLTPSIRQGFIQAGFRPKLVTSYEADVVITHTMKAVKEIREVAA